MSYTQTIPFNRRLSVSVRAKDDGRFTLTVQAVLETPAEVDRLVDILYVMQPLTKTDAEQRAEVMAALSNLSVKVDDCVGCV